MRIKLYSRPKDRSLEAFKEWIQGRTYRLGTNAASAMILEPWIGDRQWVEYWEMFWAKADAASRRRRPGEG